MKVIHNHVTDDDKNEDDCDDNKSEMNGRNGNNDNEDSDDDIRPCGKRPRTVF